MKRRQLLNVADDELDPAAGLVNLFDVAMVFAVALMVALVNYLSLGDLLSGDDITLVIHDWGSMIGFRWAADHPDRVRAVAFMEAMVRPLSYADLPGSLSGHDRRA